MSRHLPRLASGLISAVVAAAVVCLLPSLPLGAVPAAPLWQAPAPQTPAPQTPPQTPPPQISVSAQPAPAGVAGTDTCLTCHTDKGDTLKGTAHGQAANPRSPAAGLGCESCHGPGQAHVDDDAKGHMRKFAQMPASEVSETCLTCHNRGNHAAWEGSTHEARKLGVHDLPQRAQPEVGAEPAEEDQRDRSCARPATACRWRRPSAPWRTCRCARAR